MHQQHQGVLAWHSSAAIRPAYEDAEVHGAVRNCRMADVAALSVLSAQVHCAQHASCWGHGRCEPALLDICQRPPLLNNRGVLQEEPQGLRLWRGNE